MDLLQTLSKVEHFSPEILPTLTTFTKDYDAAGKLQRPTTQAAVTTMTKVITLAANYLTTTLHPLSTATSVDISMIDLPTAQLLFNAVGVLKIITRVAQPLTYLSILCTPEVLKVLFQFSSTISALFRAYITSPTTDGVVTAEHTEIFAQLLSFRLEASRLFQNLTILNKDAISDLITKTPSAEDTRGVPAVLSYLIEAVEDMYLKIYQQTHDKLVLNVDPIRTILAQCPGLQIQNILGLMELQHTLRALAIIISTETRALICANFGLIKTLYRIFYTITRTPFEDDVNFSAITTEYLIHPAYGNAQNLAPFGLGQDVIAMNSKQALYVVYRQVVVDITRPLHIFGMHSAEDDHMAFYSTKCLGVQLPDDEGLNDAVALGYFYQFVETVFYLLSLGVKQDMVPAEISTPISTILSLDYLYVNYVVQLPPPPGAAEDAEKITYGYNKQQVELLEQSTIFDATTTTPTPADLYLPTTPAIFPDSTTILGMKQGLIKVFNRLPLELCSFLYLHQTALTYIWKLFTACIDTYLSPTTPNPNRDLPERPASAQEQVTELMPEIEALLKILKASMKIEQQSKALITPELAALYQKIGLSTLAQVVKTMLFGPYADPEFEADVNPNNQARVDLSDSEEEEEDDDVCGDFEAFADNFDETQQQDKEEDDKKKNNNTSAEDEGRVSVGSFLRSLPDPTEKQLERQWKKQQQQQSNQPMIPAGGVSELLLDKAQNTTLKARVLLLMLYAAQGDVGLLLQELMWSIAYENTDEYIRLCGFGRAIGLLANKGLPGFAGFAQQGLDLSSLIGGGKK